MFSRDFKVGSRGGILAHSAGVRRLVRFIIEETKRQNLSQRELSERSGAGQATISRIFSGHAAPSLESLEALAKGLGYSLVSFLLLFAQSKQGLYAAEIADLLAKLPEGDQQIVLELTRALLSRLPSTEQ